MEQEILNVIKIISWPGAIALIAILFYKSGLLRALVGKMSQANSEKRVSNLEDFKKEAEDNHFHDLGELKTSVKELRDKVDNINGRLIRVETKINGNTTANN